jgi:hypothetical protein
VSDVVPIQRTLQSRFGVSTGFAQSVSSPGATTVYTPAAGSRARLKWIGLSSPAGNTAETVVSIRFAAGTPFYIWNMGAPGAFAHGTVREGGVDEPLIVSLTAGQMVYVNFDVEDFS